MSVCHTSSSAARLSGGAVRLVQALRRVHWAGVVSVLAAVALLVVFQQVVRRAVQQGELRRQAVAEQTEALWRCKDLRSRRMREDCLLQLQMASRPDAAVTLVLIR